MVKPTKLYYSITEVAALTGLKPHILRYWETEFSILRPKKNRAGNRAYRKKDIEIVKLIKQLLYADGYTIEGAKRQIRKMRAQGSKQKEKLLAEKGLEKAVRRPHKIGEIPENIEETLKEIRAGLKDILNLLGSTHSGKVS